MKYYFVSYLVRKVKQFSEWIPDNTKIKKMHPSKWQKEMNKTAKGCEYKVTFFAEITKEEYEI